MYAQTWNVRPILQKSSQFITVGNRNAHPAVWKMQKAECTIDTDTYGAKRLGESNGFGFPHVGRPWATEQLIMRKVFCVCV